ncbi:hypothetical protein [Methylobacterium sp. WSM2598]|uniref:hypothetical protein n=1 Tax=Methylobacterium sp. WSM2598 TaxID=398261 RepID=UPI0012F68423|nr:hypothetical protein [Methylobacterium sp. WSM2598]
MTVQAWPWLTLSAMSPGAAAIRFPSSRRSSDDETGRHDWTRPGIGLPLAAAPAAHEDCLPAHDSECAVTTQNRLQALATDARHSGMPGGGAVFGMPAANPPLIATALSFDCPKISWTK